MRKTQCDAVELSEGPPRRCENDATRRVGSLHFCEEHCKMYKRSGSPESIFFSYDELKKEEE